MMLPVLRRCAGPAEPSAGASCRSLARTSGSPEGCCESSRIEGRHKEDRGQEGGGEGCTNKGDEKGGARQEGCGQKGRCEGGHGCCTGGHGTCRSVAYRQEYSLTFGSISHSAARAVATASVYHGTSPGQPEFPPAVAVVAVL